MKNRATAIVKSAWAAIMGIAAITITAIVMTLCAAPSFAQQTSTILGVVKDSSGATVPGANVTATNTDTALARTTITGDDGAFRVAGLQPGHYSVKVEKSGFKTATAADLTLDVAQEMVVNPTMEVGATSQEVVVTGEAPVVNTTTSSLGGLVNEERMSDLPLNGRNFIDLTLLQPGVSQNKNQGSGGGIAGTYFSANGAPTRSNYMTIDGAPMVNQLGGSTGSEGGTTLGVDGIKEYRIVTNNFSADYGMTMGSQMIIASKGGSNQFHGDAFEYLRNNSLDSRNYFDTAQTAGKNQEGVQRRLPPFQRNNFGGSFGGPIRKDKTFFYGVYEGLRQNVGYTVIDQVLAGNCHGAANATITSAQCPQLGAVSSVKVAPVMAPLIALMPYDTTNLTSSLFTTSTPDILNEDFAQFRLDQNISSSDTIFGRYTLDNANLNFGSGSITQATTGIGFPEYIRLLSPSRNQFFTLSENHIFDPALLNTARISFSRTNFKLHENVSSALFGPNVSFVSGEPMGTFQSVPGLSNFGTPIGSGPNPDNYHVQNIYTFSDDLFYTHGKNALKFGTLINRFNQGVGGVQAAVGQIFFSSIANFLSGVYTNYIAQTEGLENNFDFIYNTFGFYVQDDYRATSRLTLNLGLRYEFNTTPYELNGRQAAFRNIYTDATATPGPIIDDRSYTNFSPRLGFAYDVFGDGKTAIRGGWGLYYDIGNIGNALYQGQIALPPLEGQSTSVNPTGTSVLPALPLFSNLTTPPVANTRQTINYNAGEPHLMQYNLTIERQLPGDMGLSVSYAGSRGYELWVEDEANPIVPLSITNGVPTFPLPFLCGGNQAAVSTAGCSANPAYHRINPNFATTVLDTTTSSSWYNALQVVVNRRLVKGLEFQSAYTYSKSLDTAQGQGYSTDCTGAAMASGINPYNELFDKGPSCFDLTHNWRFSLLYFFPTVKANRLVSTLANGWWVGNIVSANSGYPFSISEGANRSESGVFTGKVVYERANANTAASIASTFPAACTSLPGQKAAGANPCAYTPIPYNKNTVVTGNPSNWFNEDMFSLQPIGTFGNTERGLLRGPGLAEWDFSLVKDTKVPKLGEAGSLQFRAEFFNILNHANFAIPTGATFSGAVTDNGTYSEIPSAAASKITATSTTSRQIQFALKLVF